MTTKFSISSLVVEVTRVCNMSCDHCLRGKAQKSNIDHKYIDSLLDQLSYVGIVTFTGGEPSLNVKAIEYFLIKAKELNVEIGSFYIATNGLKVSEKFVMVCLKLYAYCDDKENCGVDVSNDYYHQIEGSYNTELLGGLTFFRRKHSDEGYHYDGDAAINEGNYAEYFGDGQENNEPTIKTKENFTNEGDVYLNCEGKIINGCNWSYESQKNNVLCDVVELSSFYESLED